MGPRPPSLQVPSEKWVTGVLALRDCWEGKSWHVKCWHVASPWNHS